MALKSTRYQKVKPAALNRRTMARHQVNITGSFVKRSQKNKIQATILDVSIYGCKLALDAILPEGEVIQIQIADTDSVDATIVWQKAREVGCRFADAISPQKMKALTPSS